jgi:HK97 family phage prohead protease
VNPIEIRAATVAAVSHPERMIELVVMPYDEETVVEYRGRMIREVCSPGAYDGIERRANRVKVNFDHDPTQRVGRAVAFHPSRREGLVAECLISRSPAGDVALNDAEDGLLDVSAGFVPIQQRMEPGPLRRITKAFLDHISLVDDPAYQGARVLAVRSAAEQPVSTVAALDTPNLDQIRLWRLQAEYERLGATNG